MTMTRRDRFLVRLLSTLVSLSCWTLTTKYNAVLVHGMVDASSSNNFSSSSSSWSDPPPSFLLGVMIDGGRNHFSIEWMQAFLHDLHRIGMNTLHLTLTNDQRFNLFMDDDDDELNRLTFAMPQKQSSTTITNHGKEPPQQRKNPKNATADSEHDFIGIYSVEDWNGLVKQAQSLDMQIVPELSLPMHAASWAGGGGGGGGGPNNNMVVECPKYICSVGNAVPLNIQHPQLEDILTRVLQRLVSVLGRPPLLHLGSNDVSLGEACWKEAIAMNGKNTNNGNEKYAWEEPDYDRFEDTLQRILVEKVGYKPDQVIRRWDTTDPRHSTPSSNSRNVAGTFSEYKNHLHALINDTTTTTTTLHDNEAKTTTHRYLLQPKELDIALAVGGAGDTKKGNRTTGWYFYQQAVEILQMHRHHQAYSDSSTTTTVNNSFRGLIVSTEATTPLMLEQRNALGKLLAVSMAAQAVYGEVRESGGDDNSKVYTDRAKFEKAYLSKCLDVFGSIDKGNSNSTVENTTVMSVSTFCHSMGGLPVPTKRTAIEADRRNQDKLYKKTYQDMWQSWTEAICQRLTITKERMELVPPTQPVMNAIQDTAFAKYWQDLNEESDHVGSIGLIEEKARTVAESRLFNERDVEMGGGLTEGYNIPQKEASQHSKDNDVDISINKPPLSRSVFASMAVPHRGIVVDLVNTLIDPQELIELMQQILVPLGLNTMQISLMTKLGTCIQLNALKELFYLVPKPSGKGALTDEDLRNLVTVGDQLDVQIIPEISMTTGATGWYHAGLLVHCPKTFCESGEIVNDVTKGTLLPVLLAVVRELYGIFHNHTSFLHLGSDERVKSQACWNESGKTPDYDLFEDRFASLLAEKKLYNQDHIMRWQNKENTAYPKRTGRLTSCRYGIPQSAINRTGNTASDCSFGTLSLPSDFNPWKTYQETRRWAALQPHGLLLEMPLLKPELTKQNLVAFAIGLSTSISAFPDALSFQTFLKEFCASHPILCPKSNKASSESRGIKPLPRSLYLCQSMTRSTTTPAMREWALSTEELLAKQETEDGAGPKDRRKWTILSQG